MRNFYEIDSSYFINMDTYLNEWIKKIDIKLPSGEYNKQRVQSLGSQSLNLWQQFNTNRDESNPVVKDKNYMESHMQAYLASFLFPNIERIFSLLIRDENISTLINLFLQDKDEFVIADFGAGPLSATVGLLCAIEYILKTNAHLFAPKKIKVFAIERSEKIYQQGLQLLKNSLFDSDSLSIERVTSVEKVTQDIHVALCANVFNEIPQKHRLGNLNQLYSKLQINGALVIIEPGQEVHSKSLSQLRDEFLSQAENCQVISPCPHNKPCPLSPSSGRKDWCWFRHGWNPPAEFKEIEKYSKIDHHFLNFSYFFISKSQYKGHEPYYGRIVSDKIRIAHDKKTVQDYFKLNLEQGSQEELKELWKEENAYKELVCSEEGSLKSILFGEEEVEDFKRGMKIGRKNTLHFVAKEKMP